MPPARLLALALPGLLAACAEGPTSVYVGDRRVFTTAPAAPADPAAAQDPAAAAAPAGFSLPRLSLPRLSLSTNIPVYVGDRLVSPGTPDPDD